MLNLKLVLLFIDIVCWRQWLIISIIEGNPKTLPQIRIDDAEAKSCLNVTAIICPNNLRLIIICRLGTCVRSKWLPMMLIDRYVRPMTPWYVLSTLLCKNMTPNPLKYYLKNIYLKFLAPITKVNEGESNTPCPSSTLEVTYSSGWKNI
jgi:hypothetical protein